MKTSLVPSISLAVLALGFAACTPSKEDAPPKPKVSAVVKETPAIEKGVTASQRPMAKALAALPKLGPAPAWILKDLAGKDVSSTELKGKVVVVDFWATWCPPCRAEIPGYVELQKKYGDDGFLIVGISLDQAGPAVVKDFAAKFGINYPLVMGDEAVVGAFGGVEGIPTTFLIDRSGQIRDRKVGAEETAEYEKKIVSIMGEKA